ncbi:MAG: hypothetical protein ACI8W8_001064 [Rhodothermales bacterium]|jgi:hypothetical protein
MNRLLLLASLLLTSATNADSITLWKGASVQDVAIDGVSDGIVYFSYPDGRKGRAKLIDIRAIGHEWSAAVTEPASEPAAEPSTRSSAKARIANFAAFKGSRYEGFELHVEIEEERQQIPAPLIRLFVLAEDSKGIRQFRLFVNHKTDDPTVTYRLPQVNSAAFTDRRFLIELDTIVSWRAEIWLSGEMVAVSEDPGNEESDWWRLQRPSRVTTMRDMPEDELPEPEDDGPRDPVGPPPDVKCQIGFARLSRKIEDDTLYFSYGYTLRADGETAELPDVQLFALLEDPEGTRSIRSFPGEERAGDILALTGNQLNRQARVELPTGIAMPANRTAGGNRIVFWRLEANYDGHIVAAKESTDIRIKRQLPPEWWLKRKLD